ncbi:NAD(P)-dependent oxidoreductase [Microbacteriaceae bacterium 4G12]
MHICLLGATGRTGHKLLELALQEGHTVTALVRNPEKLSIHHDRLHTVTGDVLKLRDVQAAMSNCDAVISALGTDGNQTLSKSMALIIQAMEQARIKRIVTIGTAGILQARSQPSLYRFQSSESRRRSTTAAEDHLQAYLYLNASNLDWTIVCPTHLVDGEATHHYRAERDQLPIDGMKISTGDTAHFAYEEVCKSIYNASRVGIAY